MLCYDLSCAFPCMLHQYLRSKAIFTFCPGFQFAHFGNGNNVHIFSPGLVLQLLCCPYMSNCNPSRGKKEGSVLYSSYGKTRSQNQAAAQYPVCQYDGETG